MSERQLGESGSTGKAHQAAPAVLALPGDGAPTAPSVESFLAAWAERGAARAAAARVVAAVEAAAVPLARRLARGEVPGDPKRSVGVNTGGDTQKALDVAAHDHFVRAFTDAGVRAILSEEAEDVIAGAGDGAVAVAIDPVDGSGSIGIGAPLGRGCDFNMRWLAAAVGELHRILRRGGAFFYVGDRRPGYGDGRLRLIYEANPIAFLCEQAGGAATDGVRPIRDRAPGSLHQHTPLVFGCADEVETFARYAARDHES